MGVGGAGGLGSPLIAYLAAAGVGTIRVVDDDEVALSNLQRQILHGTADVGRSKTASAADAVARLNPHVSVELRHTRFAPDNGASLIASCTVVADGSDNAATRYAVADACHASGIPLVSAAVNGFDGHVTTLMPHKNGPDGEPYPRYRCLFPDPPPDGMVDECARHGVLGAVTGVLGTLQATEVIKIVTGVGEPLVGRLLLYDARRASFETIRYEADKARLGTFRSSDLSVSEA